MKKTLFLLFTVFALLTTGLQAQVHLGVNVGGAIASGALRDLNAFSVGGGFSAQYRMNPRLGIGADFQFNPFKGDSMQISASVLQLQITPTIYQRLNANSELYFTAGAGVFFGRYAGTHTLLESHNIIGFTPRLGYSLEIGPGTQLNSEIFYAFTPFPDNDFAEGSNYLVGDYRFFGLRVGITYSLAEL